MKFSHLAASLLAVLVTVCGLAAGEAYASGVEGQYVYSLAPLFFPQKNLGNAVQRAAARQPDIVTIYGSSELMTAGGQFYATTVFQNEPSGFMVFPVATAGAGNIIIAEDIAANAAALRGKRVIISLSPGFFIQPMLRADDYAGDFSTIDANELVFSEEISWDLKQRLAARMLQYPTTLQDPLLRLEVSSLADPAISRRAVYFLLWPIGKLHNWIYELQDHWAALTYIRDTPHLKPGVRRRPSDIDWNALLEQSTKDYAAYTQNPFAIADSAYKRWLNVIPQFKNNLTDQEYSARLGRSTEWQDLKLVLEELHQIDANVLVVSVPLNGRFYDYRGVSASGREAYYRKLEELTKGYGVPVVDFKEHEYDPYFFFDIFDHISLEGWVYYDHAIDDWYQGKLTADR